jgi:ribosomal protein S12 methylthiotransferase accessory factor
VSDLSQRRIQPERVLSWCRATRPADGSEAWLPADICLRRPPARRDLVPPFPLSIGSAAGPSREIAALHGLLELIERDAASLWWRGGQRARSIPAQHAAVAVAEELLLKLRQGAPAPRRTWLLDITTDIGVPSVAAVSCRADGSGFAFGLAARPTLEAAVRSAILEMCQGELADVIVAAKRSERGDDALNAQDRIHLQRAAVNADQCRLLHPVAEHVAHLPIHATEASAVFELIVERLNVLGIDTFCIDLTRECFAVPVVRVIAPGLQLEPSDIVTPRLQHMIARTGGGAIYTGGISLI